MIDIQVIFKTHKWGQNPLLVKDNGYNAAAFLLGRETLNENIVSRRQQQGGCLRDRNNCIRLFAAKLGPVYESIAEMGWIYKRHSVLTRIGPQEFPGTKVDDAPRGNVDPKIAQGAPKDPYPI
jgi:hypothetical protein